LPSGTAVQAEVTETYRLANGQVASEERRLDDVLLFQSPVPLCWKPKRCGASAWVADETRTCPCSRILH
jgi:hypothetical protein